MSRKLYSLNALAEELGRDRRLVTRALDGFLRTALSAIDPSDRPVGDAESVVDELEAIGDELRTNLRKLATIRRKFVEGGAFRKLGQLANGIENAAKDDADRRIMECYVNHAIAGPVINEMMRLCEWGYDPEP
jgi:hypothetical protein